MTDAGAAPVAARVLLLEDEPVVRALVREILERAGYDVVEATSAEEALASAAEVDVLVTDVVMPQMSGPEIAAELAAVNPSLAVLFMSGYNAEAVVPPGFADGAASFLQKPFTAAELTAKLREVLAARPG